MCGLKASDVREELVSGTGREAECDFVYGEIKPLARVSLRFPATPASIGLLSPSFPGLRGSCRPCDPSTPDAG